MTWALFFRILLALLAATLAIGLIRELTSGRVGFGERGAERTADPRAYWGGVGKTAILLFASASFAIIDHRGSGTALLVGLFAAQLFEKLVAGRYWRLSSDEICTRANAPGPYWRSVALDAAITALFTFFLIEDWNRVTTS